MGGLLDVVLGDAQHRGFLGSGEIDGFVRHALGYLEGLGETAVLPGEGVDLGPGGGIPGLVLATKLPETNWHLIERSRGRADWLIRSVARLGMTDRVMVHHEAAEITGRGPLRGRCGFVVARRFAAPAVAAECAAPLLRVGGRAVFSDLQGPSGDRWDEDQLAKLGMALVRSWQSEHGSYLLLAQRSACPDRFPRSPGVPVRRPLF
jgi:16S rRNA (guanine527-N7)-methyltransferase